MEHLTEEQLLAIADGEATDHEHLGFCRECHETVEDLRAARTALRAAPPLELSPDRVRDLVASLPEQERVRVRRLRGWPRVAVLLAPVAAGAALLGVSVGTSEEISAPVETEIAMSAPAEDSRAAGGGALESAQAKRACPAPDASTQAPIATVQGPADEVVALLRDGGIEAVQCEAAVEVPALETERVLELLAERPDGPVEVRSAAVP